MSVMISLLLVSENSYSQEKKHEVSAVIGGVFSFIDYDLNQGNLAKGDGISIGLRYSYYLNTSFSLGLGADYQSYNSSTNFVSINEEYVTTDVEGESFEFRAVARNLKENQKLSYINIPITLQYESLGLTRFYMLAGAKVGFLTNGKRQTTIDNLTTSGYYPQYNAELFGPAFVGFGSFDNLNVDKQDLDTKIAYSAIVESGIKQILGAKQSIYIGFYLDYGLNNIREKNQNKNLIEYTPDATEKLKYNSVFDSSYTDDLRLISYGVKVRFAFY